MPVVEKSTHIGVHKFNKNSALLTIEENIKKARKTVYNLMGSGLHGRTGVDPETDITIFRTCVLPVLTYVLEILLPTGKALDILNQYHKKLLKQIVGSECC
jgi:hypothetical protein